MQPRVTAVLVARNGAEFLPRTRAAIESQLRRPDSLVVVDAGSSDGSADALGRLGAAQFVTAPGSPSFGAAVAHAERLAPASPGADEWLWLLAHDSAPEPGALAALLAAVEVAPSVAIAGPKLMRWDSRDIIASFGETVSRFGTTVRLVTDELDQAQFDRTSDVLAVGAAGMLIRRSVFSAVGGFDQGLPGVDAGLDLSIRVRLAGHRIIGVPAARVATAGAIESFGRTAPSRARAFRSTRVAQLHRRLVYANPVALPFLWLSLLPLAVVRSLWHLLAKRPGRIAPEFASAVIAAFDPTVPGARANLRRSRSLGWAAVAPFRMPLAELRELRAHDASIAAGAGARSVDSSRPGFLSHGGAWVVLLLAAVSLIAFAPLLGGRAVVGGGVLPLSGTIADLWSNVGVGWRSIGAGFTGPADPFAFVLAIVGTLTFWSPSTAIAWILVASLPIAGLGAWLAVARLSTRGWAPAVAAVAWAVAPPLLTSVSSGHLGAVIAHLALPYLVVALLGSARSWASAAAASLLLAVVVASAPSLAAIAVVTLIALLVARPRGIARTIFVAVPTAVLFAPLVVAQLARGTALALVADPGLPLASDPVSAIQLVLGSPEPGHSGWVEFLAGLGAGELAAGIVVAALLAPLALVALTGLAVPGSRRAIVAMLVALGGYLTAVAATRIEVSAVGSESIAVWAGPGLSVLWLGLIGAAVVAIEALDRRAALPALVVAVASIVVAVPLLSSVQLGTALIGAGNGRTLPAFTAAEAADDPDLGTLELVAQPDGGIAATVHRGAGTTLDEQSTLAATATSMSDLDERVATLAGNLASASGFDATAELDALHLAFILVPEATDVDARSVRDRAVEALDANPILQPIGETATGFLWRYEALADGAAPTGPGPTDTLTGVAVLAAQGGILVIAALLAIPTSRRRRTATATPGEPAQTFESDDDE